MDIPVDIYEKDLKKMQKEYSVLKAIDFFNAPLKAQAAKLIKSCINELKTFREGVSSMAEKGAACLDTKDFRGRRWVTRVNPHVDRMASAWLIKRFIDPEASFTFLSEKGLEEGDIPCDVMGARFGHRGKDCTFETILKEFCIRDETLWDMAEIVHDMDLKDDKYSRPEATGIEDLVRGLKDIYNDDHELLQMGFTLFEALYQSLKRKQPRASVKERP